ncbi:ABC transporter substrate-binding protein [Microbacterium sp. A94]
MVGITALALSLTACAGVGTAEEANDENTLTIWGWRGDAPWVEMLEGYGADNGVAIEYSSFKGEEYNSVLQNGLSSSSGPDIVMLRSYGGLSTLVAGGQIAALDEASSPALANMSEAAIDGARMSADGKVYGVPFQIVTGNIIYNADLLAEHDLTEPTTWEEFVELNDALLEVGVTPMAAGVLDSWILPIYRDLFAGSVYGGAELAEAIAAGDTDFTDPGYAEANEVLLKLAKYFPKGFEGLNYEDAKSLFASGQAAMYPGGIWELATFQESMQGTELGLFDVPAVDGGETLTMGYVDGSFGMSAALEGDSKAAAEDFLEWVGSAEFGQLIADDLLSLPVVEGVVPSDELLAVAAEGFQAHPAPYLTYVHFDNGTPSGTTLEYDNLQKMMIGSISPAEVGVAVQTGISQWFTPSP